MISQFHTIDTFLALAVALINFVFAILVMARTSRTNVYLIFFFICVCNIIWNLGDFMFFVTDLRTWLYFSLIGSSMLPALMFHFVRIMVAPQRRSSGLIIPAYFFSGMFACSGALAIFNGKVQAFVDSSYWNILYLILLGPFLILGIVMLIYALKQAESDIDKKRLRYILIVMLIGISTGLTDLVQLLKVPLPPLGHLGCLVYSSILTLGVFRHLTAFDILAQMRMRLEDLSQMAAGIAHEIRNPLTSIKGASALLGKELKATDHPQCWEYHQLIAEEIERIDNILRNFQYFTRPLKVEKDLVPINDVISKTVKLAEVGALDLGLKLELSWQLPTVLADASLMKQVFLNLIKNARDACGTGGELIIRTESASPFLRISFCDNGPGIPSELIPRIFEPFFTTKAAGMGVGLAISQRIIQAHGGRIEVENLIPQGAHFSVFLPFGEGQ